MKNAIRLPFKSATELQDKINRYFSECAGIQALDENGSPLFAKDGSPIMAKAEKSLTVSGLALAIGFNSRKQLFEFNGKKIYKEIIDRALSVIENFGESRLLDKGQFSGAKFFLVNNFSGWSDTPEFLSEADSLKKLDDVLNSICCEVNSSGGTK